MLRIIRWTSLRNWPLRMDPEYIIEFQPGEMKWEMEDC